MAIGGINSYYSYQSSINNFRLSQALSNNPRYVDAISRTARTSSRNGMNTSYRSANAKSNLQFVRQYNSNMSDLMSAANSLKTSNSKSAFSNLAVTSSDTSVATVTEKFPARTKKSLTLDVKQLATAQTNVSKSVNANDKAASGMNFTLQSKSGSVNVKVGATGANGKSMTNVQMLNEAARQINAGKANVTASVTTDKSGQVALQLQSKSTGEVSAFTVSGSLGAASGADTVKTAANDSRYSVTSNGTTLSYQASTNDVSVDATRIGVSLKSVGKTTIETETDQSAISSAVSDLVSAYNRSIEFLNDNYDRGTGIDKQLRNLVNGLGSEKSMAKIGITVNKDATLSLDKSVLAKSLKDDPSLAKDILSGTNGIANTAFRKATEGMRVSASSLTNGSASGFNTQMSSATNPYSVFNLYSGSGSFYNSSNYYTVGLMMNYLA